MAASWRRWFGVALVVLTAASVLAGDAPREPSERIPRTPEFVERIGKSIDGGLAWLKRTQGADGSYRDFPNFAGGTTALAYYTLRVCGVPKEDPSAKKAWDSLRRSYAKSGMHTYSAAMYLLAISSHVDVVDVSRDARDVRLTTTELAWASEIADLLVRGQRADGTWGYNVGGRGSMLAEPADYYDHSNTQCALLALQCAARCGVRVDRRVWEKALTHFVAAQQQSGPSEPRDVAAVPRSSEAKSRTTDAITDHARGWGYKSCAADTSEPQYRLPTVSMTAGGVSSIVICRSELLEGGSLRRDVDVSSLRAAWDGLAWVGTKWVVGVLARPDALPEQRRQVLAALFAPYDWYSVERAGILAGVERMAGLDWYGEGASALMDVQRNDGGWSGRAYPGFTGDKAEQTAASLPVDTCFALLFLKRGTMPVRLGAVTSAGDDRDINFAEAAKTSGRDLDDFLDLVLSRASATSDQDVRRRLFDGATSVGPKTIERLLVRLDIDDDARRVTAHALLRHATGQDFGYSAADSPESRAGAIAKWQEWWLSVRDRLVYDPEAKRLVVR